MLCAALLLGFAFPVMAVNQLNNQKYFITNNSATSIATIVSTDIIPASGEAGITRLEVTPILPSGATTGCNFVSIYDSNDLWGTSAGWMEGEIEAAASVGTLTKTYTRPLKITNGVVIVQGAYTVASVEWEYLR